MSADTRLASPTARTGVVVHATTSTPFTTETLR